MHIQCLNTHLCSCSGGSTVTVLLCLKVSFVLVQLVLQPSHNETALVLSELIHDIHFSALNRKAVNQMLFVKHYFVSSAG